MTENDERRKHTRIGNDMPLSFSLSVLEFTDLKHIEASGQSVDRSEDGLGFFTDFPLEPGHVIRIKKDEASFMTASVQWVGAIEGKYRIGVLIYK